MHCDELRQHLLELLRGGSAHLTFDEAVADVPANLRGAKPAGVPHTPWRLIEHMRIAQHDILEFTRNPNHVSPPWPDGYWPDGDGPPMGRAWNASIKRFRDDLNAMCEIVADPKMNLLDRIPHGSGQTIAREALLLADHSAYHIGQLIVVRRCLGAWDR